MKPHSSTRSGFTLFEMILAVTIFAVLALMLVSALFLVVRGQGFTLSTNDNTNNAGQIMNRIVHGVGSHRPLREAVKGRATIIPAAQGGWTLEYVVKDAPIWIRYNPTTHTIFNQLGRILGRDIASSGVSTNTTTNLYGQIKVDSVDLWLSVQGSPNGRALPETVSTRVQLRNTEAQIQD